MRELFTAANDTTLDLLQSLLTLDPGARISAPAALEHAYFSSQPPAASAAELAPWRKAPPPEKATAEKVAGKEQSRVKQEPQPSGV